MISGIEEVLVMIKPDAVILYGDTNSTLAGAVAAAKLHVPVIHIEAGLRSFNKSMPEEINRIMCDHASTLLFSPTVAGMDNLAREGFKLKANPPYHIDNPGVFHTGDIMYDNSLFFAEKAGKIAPLGKFGGLGLKPDKYVLVTIHRDNNTDDAIRLNNIFAALLDIAEGNIYASRRGSFEDVDKAEGVDVIIPLHPRTSKMLKQNLAPELYKKIIESEHIRLTEPASFFEMISLEKGAQLVITDSGGVQKEAFFFCKPSLILRPQTEWVEIVQCGAALLVDADYDKILAGYKTFTQVDKSIGLNIKFPSFFGDGNASEAILEILLNLQ
jgi:UDP-GlcNAc3NAcA epimerase